MSDSLHSSPESKGNGSAAASLEEEIERRRKGYYDGPPDAFAWKAEQENQITASDQGQLQAEFAAKSYPVPALLLFMCAAMLVMAALPMPYRFYELVRLFASVTLLWGALTSARRGSVGMAICYGALGLLFNPVLPVHLPKIVWSAIDLAVAAALVMQHKRLT